MQCSRHWGWIENHVAEVFGSAILRPLTGEALMLTRFDLTDFVVWATPYLNFSSSLASIVAIVAALGLVYRSRRHPLSVIHVLVEHAERHPEEGGEPFASFTKIHIWVSNRSDYLVQIKQVSLDSKFDYVLKRLNGGKYGYYTIMFGPNTIGVGGSGQDIPARGVAVKIPSFEGLGTDERPRRVYVTLDTSHGRLRVRKKIVHTEFVNTVESEEILSHSRIETILRMHWLNIRYYFSTRSHFKRRKR